MPDSERPRTAAILTLGCKLNIADSEAMARRLRQAGWNVVERLDPGVDSVIVNSCSVTRAADQKSRHYVRLAQRLAPGASVALTGCLLETASQDTITSLSAGLVRRQGEQALLVGEIVALHPAGGAPVAQAEAPRPALKTRAFIAAQEGCNDVCAFCVIPRTRGRERSKQIETVVQLARQAEAEGAQEIVITGTQLGAYGRDNAAGSPADLLAALLRGTSAPRIRMSSLQPQDITPPLVELWQDPRLCRHFHLALQSGSEGVLQRMRRRYSKQQYRDAVLRLRQGIPGVAITTDVIAGFPGESDAEFDECLEFCREMAFAGMHVFPYSQRNGTLAPRLPGQVDEAVKKERVHRLIDLGAAMAATYRRGYLGREVQVLWEDRDADGRWQGLTDTYVRVRAPGADELYNRLTPALVLELEDNGLAAEVAAT